LLDETTLAGSTLVGRDLSQSDFRLLFESGPGEYFVRQILSFSPAILYRLKLNGADVTDAWVSDNVKMILGYEAESCSVAWWTNNLHPEDRAAGARHIAELLHEGRLVSEYRFRHQNGQYRWIHDEKRLLRGPDNQPTECVGSWFDITERKQLEEQFRQAQKMEAVGRLAGGVAHDFNNALTAIIGFSDVALGSLLHGDPLREIIDQVKKAGERASHLTRQLLTFSRKQVVVPVVLDLNAVLAEMQKMLGRLLGEDIDLAIVPGANLWHVTADAGQVEQVIMNLAVNARDAMPAGGRITIQTHNAELDREYSRTHPQVAPGDYVLLAVTDTGCGMDAATKARIFEPFFTTKGPERGTGLGLATVYGIIKQSGGHIDVSSEPGLGTSFKIYLPRERQVPRSSRSMPGPNIMATGNETVLLAEDEDGVRALSRIILQKQGYKVLEARHGGEALFVGEQHAGPIDLLIADLVMPHMNGHQLAERLASTRPNMKVLFMSGYTDDAVVRHGVLEPGLPFLQKPFTPSGLAQKVREVLDHVTGPEIVL
jgi:PAS domain S-box-containing protein